MLYSHPQSNQNSATQGSDSSLSSELLQAIEHILNETQPTRPQIEMLQQYLASQSLKSSYQKNNSPRLDKTRQDNYSPTIKLAFNALKYFSLFLLGTGITFVISASLQATSVVSILTGLLSLAFIPIAVVTFCIVAIAIILESFK